VTNAVIEYLSQVILSTSEIWFFLLLVGLAVRMLTTVLTKGRIEFI